MSNAAWNLKQIIFAALIGVTAFSRPAHASLWEGLSRTAAYYDDCSKDVQAATEPKKELVLRPTLPPANVKPEECDIRIDPVRAITQNAAELTKESYFAALAKERADADQCASDFIKGLLSKSSDFEKYSETMHKRTQLLVNELHNLMQLRQQLFQKANSAEGKKDRAPQDDLRKRIDQSMRALVTHEKAVPLGEIHGVKDLVMKYVSAETALASSSGEAKPIDKKSFAAELRAALSKGKAKVDEDIKTLREGVSSTGKSLGTFTRESLAQDRDLVQRMLSQNPKLAEAGVQKVACEVDRVFNEGAKKRDDLMMKGSIALTVGSVGVGLIAKGAVAGSSLFTAGRLAAAEGVMPLASTRLLVSAASLGMDITTGAKEISKSCGDQRGVGVKLSAKKSPTANRCQGFSMEDLEQQDCVATSVLTAMGVGLSLPGVSKLPSKLTGNKAEEVNVAKPTQASETPRARGGSYSEKPVPSEHALSAETEDYLRKKGVRAKYDPDSGSHIVEPDETSLLGRHAQRLQDRKQVKMRLVDDLGDGVLAEVVQPGRPDISIAKRHLSSMTDAQLATLIEHESTHVRTATGSPQKNSNAWFALRKKSKAATEGPYGQLFGADEVDAFYAGGRKLDLIARNLEKSGKVQEAKEFRALAQSDYQRSEELRSRMVGITGDIADGLRKGKMPPLEMKTGEVTQVILKPMPGHKNMAPLLYDRSSGHVTVELPQRNSMEIYIPKGLAPSAVQSEVIKWFERNNVALKNWERRLKARERNPESP